MSGGGAGKVYFVLYLAVILELLIIIVERDEAEEHLIQKQKESMKIVESILSQLQAGSGSEGITTRPQDEIQLQDLSQIAKDDPRIRQDRTYQIIVGVTDVSGADKVDGLEPAQQAEKRKTLVKLANVQDLEYQIFYSPTKEDQAPEFPAEDSLRKMGISLDNVGAKVGEWELRSNRKLNLNVDETLKRAGEDLYKMPIYDPATGMGEISQFVPNGRVDSAFTYSQEQTDVAANQNGGKYKKRVFMVRFQPPKQPGWYKLRFRSKVNKILGVRSDVSFKEISPEEKINIGTVQLKVKDLQKVKKELMSSLEGVGLPDPELLGEGKITGDEFSAQCDKATQEIKTKESNVGKAEEKIRRVTLFEYISKLLAPTASSEFNQNKGAMEFDLHVLEQPKRKENDAVIAIENENPVGYDKLTKIEIPFQATFVQGKMPSVSSTPSLNLSVVEATTAGVASTSGGGSTKRYKVVVNRPTQGDFKITVNHSNAAGKQAEPGTINLKVFDTKLENEEDLRSTVENLTFGQQVELNVVPSDGKKISPSNYFVDFKVSNDQAEPTRGLAVTKEVSANSSQATLEVLYEDPMTKERISLLKSPIQGSPKQRPPRILTNEAITSPIPSPSDLTSVVSGIKVGLPLIDAGGVKAAMSDVFDVKAVVQKQDIPGYKVSVRSVKPSGGGYEVELAIDGPAPRKRGTIDGTATILITAKVKNKLNGTVSDVGKAVYTAGISY